MKTKQFLLVIVALVITTNVFATETPKMSVIPLKDTKAIVTIAYETPSINEISIVSENGSIMYYKRSKKPMTGYRKIFDLSQLESGKYELNLRVGKTAMKKEIAIEDGVVSVQKPQKQLEPHFSFADNMVKISYLNFENRNVRLCVFDKTRMIYSLKVGKEFAVHRALDLSALKTGNYDVLLANANKEYWFSVSK